MVEIRIKAPPKSGKTTLAARIATALKQAGYKVKVDDPDSRVVCHDAGATVHIYTEQKTD